MFHARVPETGRSTSFDIRDGDELPRGVAARLWAVVLVLTVSAFGSSSAAAAEDRGVAGPGRDGTPGETRYSRSFATYAVPRIVLVDQEGARVDLARLLGEPWPVILQFIFTTCPGVCPVLSATFGTAQGQIEAELDGVRFLSISIDPEHDTPMRLRAYAERLDAAPGWRFLTGSRQDLVRVQKAFDAYRGNKMQHEPTTYLRLAPGERWTRLDGLPSASELVAEARRLTRR